MPVPLVALPVGIVVLLAVINNPKALQFVLIAGGILLLVMYGGSGGLILAILLFVLYLVWRKK